MSTHHIEITSGGRCFRLDLQAAELYRERHERVRLTRQQWDLLNYFVKNPRVLLTKDNLQINVWKRSAINDEAISQAVRALRKALKDDKGEPNFIETDHGKGYRFIANIEHFNSDDKSRAIQGALDTSVSSLLPNELKEALTERPIADFIDILRTVSGLDSFTKQIHGPDDLKPVEDCICKSSDTLIVKNALILIARLATGWDGRTIKRSESFAVVSDFYCKTDSSGLKVEAAKTLASLGTFASRKFLSGGLKQMEPAVLAATLSVWMEDIAVWEDASYWGSEIAADLIAWVSKGVENCFFIDDDGRERDCRYGVFRILGELKIQQATVVIEDYFAKIERPIEVVIQAVGAHWRITGSEQFTSILEGAINSSASVDAKQWIEEIRLSKTPKLIVTSHDTKNGVETIEGVFERDKFFNFVVYLDPALSPDTYKQTRIIEMYISAGDVIQWTWHSLNRTEPDWRYGRVLFSDLMAGLRVCPQTSSRITKFS